MEYQLTETLKLRFGADSVSVYELRAGDPRWHLKAKFAWQLSVQQVWPDGQNLEYETAELTIQLNRLNALVDFTPTQIQKLLSRVNPDTVRAYFEQHHWHLAKETEDYYIYQTSAPYHFLAYAPKAAYSDYAQIVYRALEEFANWRECTTLRSIANFLDFAGVDVAAKETDGQ